MFIINIAFSIYIITRSPIHSLKKAEEETKTTEKEKENGT